MRVLKRICRYFVLLSVFLWVGLGCSSKEKSFENQGSSWKTLKRYFASTSLRPALIPASRIAEKKLQALVLPKTAEQALSFKASAGPNKSQAPEFSPPSARTSPGSPSEENLISSPSEVSGDRFAASPPDVPVEKNLSLTTPVTAPAPLPSFAAPAFFPGGNAASRPSPTVSSSTQTSQNIAAASSQQTSTATVSKVSPQTPVQSENQGERPNVAQSNAENSNQNNTQNNTQDNTQNSTGGTQASGNTQNTSGDGSQPVKITQEADENHVLFEVVYADDGTVGSQPATLILPATGGNILMIPQSTLSPTDPQEIFHSLGPVLYRSIHGQEEKLNTIAQIWDYTYVAGFNSFEWSESPDKSNNAGLLLRIVFCGTIGDQALQEGFSKDSEGEPVDAASQFFYKILFRGDIAQCRNPVYKDFRATEDGVPLDLTVKKDGMYLAMLITSEVEQDPEFAQKVGGLALGAGSGLVPTTEQLDEIFSRGYNLRGIRIK